jgi:hypothetical protein
MNQPMFHPPSSPPGVAPLPPLTLGCPRCGCPAVPGPAVQTCQGCQRRFTLSAGPALDGSVVPAPFHPAAMRIALRWSIVVTYRFATLEPPGINAGTLDPVVGIAPVDQTAIAYGDVLSIAVWRKLALVDCIVAALLPTPIALLTLYVAISIVAKSAGGAAVFAASGLVMGLLAAWLFRRGIVIGRRQARIVGRWASTTVPFDNSAAFHDELFRRCGIARPPVP